MNSSLSYFDYLALNNTFGYTIIRGGANGASVANGGNGLNSSGNALNDPVYIRPIETVTISETISQQSFTPCIDGSTITETIKVNTIRNIQVNESETIEEVISAIVVSVNGSVLTVGNRSTGIGSQQVANATIPVGLASYSAPTDITFTSSAGSISLRKPKFGDQDDYNVFRVQYETRDRDLIIYEDPIWPTTEILQIEFEYLLQDTSQQLITFLANCVGEKITYVDHFGRSWQGFITNPDTAIEQMGKQNFTARIEFQVST